MPVIFLQSANWAAQADLQNQLQKIVEDEFSPIETGIPSAMQAIDKAAQIARNKGYKVKILKGHEESLNAIRNWLKCGNLVSWAVSAAATPGDHTR